MRIVWLTGLAALLLLGSLAWYLAPLDPGVVALQLTFSPQAFGRVVHAWSPWQLQRFRNHLPVDGLLLLAYGAFGYLLASRSAAVLALPAARLLRARWWLPVAAAFDAAEDALHWWLTEVPRFGVPDLYVAAGTCAAFKWLLLLGFALLVIRAMARSGR